MIDGRNLSAGRSGHQLYGTIRIKDEIKKDNLILIPSGRFDIGHTILGSYKETGISGINVKKQHIKTKKTHLETIYKARPGDLGFGMIIDQSPYSPLQPNKEKYNLI